jgi:hypothetical protein
VLMKKTRKRSSNRLNQADMQALTAAVEARLNSMEERLVKIETYITSLKENSISLRSEVHQQARKA